MLQRDESLSWRFHLIALLCIFYNEPKEWSHLVLLKIPNFYLWKLYTHTYKFIYICIVRWYVFMTNKDIKNENRKKGREGKQIPSILAINVEPTRDSWNTNPVGSITCLPSNSAKSVFNFATALLSRFAHLEPMAKSMEYGVWSMEYEVKQQTATKNNNKQRQKNTQTTKHKRLNMGYWCGFLRYIPIWILHRAMSGFMRSLSTMITRSGNQIYSELSKGV